MKPLLKLGICFSLFTLALGAEAACIASIPASSPSSRFADNTDGTVTDMRTGLMWMRCSLGQTWSGSSCTGTAAQYVWADALALAQSSTFAGHGDWRVHNVKELMSIVERQCAYPAINSEIFPATTNWYYWTSSPNVSGNVANAYTVSFSQGTDVPDAKSSADSMRHYHARLVRTVR